MDQKECVSQLTEPAWKRLNRKLNAWEKSHRKQLLFTVAGGFAFEGLLASFFSLVIHHATLQKHWAFYGALIVTVSFLILWPLFCFRSKKVQEFKWRR